jgi:hypothetical protein
MQRTKVCVECDSRDKLVGTPFLSSQDGAVVGLPDGQGSLSLELPEDDEAISIAGQQTSILADKFHTVYLRSVAAQNVAGLRRSMTICGHVCELRLWWRAGRDEACAKVSRTIGESDRIRRA